MSELVCKQRLDVVAMPPISWTMAADHPVHPCLRLTSFVCPLPCSGTRCLRCSFWKTSDFVCLLLVSLLGAAAASAQRSVSGHAVWAGADLENAHMRAHTPYQYARIPCAGGRLLPGRQASRAQLPV